MRSLIILLLFACYSCGPSASSSSSSNFPDMDLMKYGMPIKIKAPEGATAEGSDLGVMKDVTVKGEDNYFIQITSGMSTTTDIKALVTQQKQDVSASEFFDSYIQEDEHGFIFKKKIGDRINHDFRYFKIQGDQEYLFQTGLMGQFTEEEVQTMYGAVK